MTGRPAPAPDLGGLMAEVDRRLEPPRVGPPPDVGRLARLARRRGLVRGVAASACVVAAAWCAPFGAGRESTRGAPAEAAAGTQRAAAELQALFRVADARLHAIERARRGRLDAYLRAHEAAEWTRLRVAAREAARRRFGAGPDADVGGARRAPEPMRTPGRGRKR